METKHTPGPWKIGLNPGPMVYTLDGVSQVADARGLAVSKDEAKANARLIAAAPELLTLVIQYRDDLRRTPTGESAERRLTAINNAIAKATS